MAGPPVPRHPGAAGEGDHTDALQQVVEEHRGRLHQTGKKLGFFKDKNASFLAHEQSTQSVFMLKNFYFHIYKLRYFLGAITF